MLLPFIATTAIGLRLPGVPKLEHVKDTTMHTLAPFLRSEGYAVALEGLTDIDGAPLAFVNGLPHGSTDEVCRQIAYMHERCLACCGDEAPRATTIVQVRTSTFRFPDAANLAAMLMTSKYYSWSFKAGKTIFVACPSIVVRTFEKLRPIMSDEQYASIVFADSYDDLAQLVPSHMIPHHMGGSATWDVESYIGARCEAEGVVDPGGVRHYTGRSVDWAALDEYDEKRRLRRERRMRSKQTAARRADTPCDSNGEGSDESGGGVVETQQEQQQLQEVELHEGEGDDAQTSRAKPRRRWRERLQGVVTATQQLGARRRGAESNTARAPNERRTNSDDCGPDGT